MPAATVDDLRNLLDDSFSWRRIELAVVKSEVVAVGAEHPAPPRDRMVLRAAVLLFYAHWEGFTRDACQHYLDFVARRRLKYNELSEDLLRTAVNRLAERSSQDPQVTAQLIVAIRAAGAVRAPMPRRGLVDTGANLRHEVVTQILRALGLPLGVIETKGQLIDRKLCDSRNTIAHGRTAYPTVSEVTELHGHVLELMSHVRDAVVGSAEAQSYRAPGAS